MKLGLLATAALSATLVASVVDKKEIAKPKQFKTEDEFFLIDNCKDLEDGSYYMKLLDDDTAPIVKVKCNSGYLIIDVNYDESMIDYFTSWAKWHASIAGPSNADIVDWNSWYLKSRENPENNKFLLSPDCNTCEESHVRQHFDEKTTYWMSGNLFGCMWMILGKHNCDLDKDTYSCYDCSQSSDPEANGDATEITEDQDPWVYYFTGQCGTAIRASDSEVTSSHDTCQLGLHWNVGTIDGNKYEDDYETNVVSTTTSYGSELFAQYGLTSTDSNVVLRPEMEKEQRNLLSDDEDVSVSWNPAQFEKEIFKPSIGTDGRFCVCSQSIEGNFIAVSRDELQEAMDKFGDKIETFHQFNDGISASADTNENIEEPVKKDQVDEELTSLNNRVELRHEDFEHGTYRIKEPGTYVIMEDIEFDFNAGSMDDPQADGAWKPFASQVEEYPGAESGRDEYFLGFFAGITIECDDVVLDLNNKRIAMSEVFYHQQRWFTVISLTSQFFLPGNGPGFFGYDPQSASNVVIKDGTIGLSSHFGIHGNYNKNVLIENVHVESFEVHGIQFNGFENLNFRNVEVGPSSTQAFLTGEYGHMRFVLDRLNKAIDDLGEDSEDAEMNFYGREAISLRDLADRCERMMNYAFDYVLQGKELTQKDFKDSLSYQEYKDAIEIFVNPSGIPYASVLHGIFLNTKEASVMTYNLYTTTYSETAYLENVKIHDLQHAMDERVRMYDDIYMFFGPFLNCLNARQLVGDDAVDYGQQWGGWEVPYQYYGSIVTDVYLALTKYSNDWDYLEKSLVGANILVPWSEGEAGLPPGTNIACNMDVMIHSGKGTTGLRLDGVKDITVNGLEVYNLHDETPLGETVCGEYYKFAPDNGGGHLAQQMPMQEGFSGNKVQAVTFNSAFDVEMNDVYIHDLESDTGYVTGLTVWPANDITFGGDLRFENFEPSSKVNEDDERYGVKPNQDHFSCAVYVYESYYKDSAEATYTTDLTLKHDSISSCNIGAEKWASECYHFSDESDTVYTDIERSSHLYDFLKYANSEEVSKCANKNEEVVEEEANVDVAHSARNHSPNVLVYGGVAFSALLVIGVIVGLRHMSNKDDKVKYSPVKSDYGSL